jgi:tetratricopeptide (TPR) repeat protein
MLGALPPVAAALACIGRPSPSAPKPDPAAAVGRIDMIREQGGEPGYSGTAFWITPGIVATVWHMTLPGPDDRQLVVTMPDGSVHTANVILGIDEQFDIALLRADPPFSGEPLKLAVGEPAPGLPVRLLTSPSLFDNPVRAGRILSTSSLDFYGFTIVIALEQGAAPGWSGAPVLNDANEVVAMSRMGGPGKSFAAPAPAIARLYNETCRLGVSLADWDRTPRTHHGASMYWFIVSAETRDNPAERENLLRDAVRMSDDFWPGWNALSKLYSARGDDHKAEEAMVHAVEHSPLANDAMDLADFYFQRRLFDQGLQAQIHAEQTDPYGFDLAMRERAAIDLMQNGRYQEALPGLEAAARATPVDYALQTNYAQCLAMTGKADEALTLLDKALKDAPTDANVHHGRGLALAHLGRDEEAVRAYLEAIRLNPRNPATMRLLGEAYVRLGRLDDARALLPAIRALHPASAGRLEQTIAGAPPK